MSKCHDCNVEEGQYHHKNCDVDICPFCFGQLLSCSCVYEILGPLYGWKYKPATYIRVPPYVITEYEYDGLPEDVYENGLTDEQDKTWQHILDLKGRIPYIAWPLLCTRCGKLWPELFSVPNAEWQKYIDKEHQQDLLCQECYDYIKSAIDKYK